MNAQSAKKIHFAPNIPSGESNLKGRAAPSPAEGFGEEVFHCFPGPVVSFFIVGGPA
jgi:hypothetical protein